MNFNQEQIKKAMECKSAEELLALAKAEGVEMTAEEAQKYFETLSQQDINLDELDKVTGGFCQGNACGSNC